MALERKKVQHHPILNRVLIVLLLTPFLWPVLYFLRAPQWVLVLVGLPAFLFLLIFGQVILNMIADAIRGPKGVKWSQDDLYDGFALITHPQQAIDTLWPTGSSVIEKGHSVDVWIRGYIAGFPVHFLRTNGDNGNELVLVELPQPLPEIKVMLDVLSKELDASTNVEDVEFNRRYSTAKPKTPQQARYFHAFLHPRMVEYLLSIEPRSFRVNGRFIWQRTFCSTTAARHFPEILDMARHFVEIAKRIPPYLYDEYSDTAAAKEQREAK